jgi:hypothetical protein
MIEPRKRLLLCAMGVATGCLLATADEIDCVSDQPIQCNAIVNGTGCHTITLPNPPYFPFCCHYVEWRCVGKQDTWRVRDLYGGEKCTDEFGGGFTCPSYYP